MSDLNILIDRLPKTVNIGSRDYRINSNFRTSILFEMMMQDSTLTKKDKAIKALQLYFPEIPKDISRAFEKITWFYGCGKTEKESSGSGGEEIRKSRVYSFEHDDDYIYSAFLFQYGIDLQDTRYLHWWKFRAMFNALTEENQFVKIMQYRSMKISADLPKEQKDFYKKMKKLYALPVSEDEMEKTRAIEEALMNGGDLTGLLDNRTDYE